MPRSFGRNRVVAVATTSLILGVHAPKIVATNSNQRSQRNESANVFPRAHAHTHLLFAVIRELQCTWSALAKRIVKTRHCISYANPRSILKEASSEHARASQTSGKLAMAPVDGRVAVPGVENNRIVLLPAAASLMILNMVNGSVASLNFLIGSKLAATRRSVWMAPRCCNAWLMVIGTLTHQQCFASHCKSRAM